MHWVTVVLAVFLFLSSSLSRVLNQSEWTLSFFNQWAKPWPAWRARFCIEVLCFPALCTGWMFSHAQHHLFVLASLYDWFTRLFTLIVIGQKWLFVYWLLRGVLCIFSSPGPKAMVNEYSCVCLHSDRSPQERKANLQAFKVTIASYTTEASAKITRTYVLFEQKEGGT